MFLPNTYCMVYARSIQQDVYSTYTYGIGKKVPCSVISFDLTVAKTSVRADSSASRGRAEEEIGTVRLLFPTSVVIKEGDMALVDGSYIECIRIFNRHNLMGKIDHLQVDFRKGVSPNV